MNFVRIWKELNVSEVDSHLLVADDLHGFCNACKKIGIPLDGTDTCPECGTSFLYVTTRLKPNSSSGQVTMNKLFKNYSDKVIIDYDDYKHLSDKQKANNLFKDI